MNNPKDIAEKILKAFDSQFIDAASMVIDCRELASAYLELEKKLEIAVIRLKNIQHRADNFDSYITIENICIEAIEEIEGEK